MRFGRSNASREELPILPVPNNENEKESYMMESITTTKKCSVCGRELPVEEFHKNKRCKDGLMSFCKECHLKSARKGGRRKAEDVVVTHEPHPIDLEPLQPFAKCVTEKDCATEALRLAIGKDAFADWKATNELYECLLKYYSR